MNKKITYFTSLLLIILISNISIFAFFYAKSKVQIEKYEAYNTFNNDNIIYPTSQLSRRNIENVYNFYNILAFSNLKNDIKIKSIQYFLKDIHLLVSNSSEYYRILNDNKFIFDIDIKKENRTELSKKFENIQSRSIELAKVFFELSNDDINLLKNPINLLNKNIEKESQKIFSKVKSDISSMSWEELSKQRGIANEIYIDLSKSLILLLEYTDDLEVNQLSNTLNVLEKSKILILIFCFFQSIFFFIAYYLEYKSNRINYLPKIRKYSFYISTMLFYFFIPITTIMYINEFKIAKSNVIFTKNNNSYYEVKNTMDDLKKIRMILDNFINNALYFPSSNYEFSIKNIDLSFLNSITSYLDFSLSKKVSTGYNFNLDDTSFKNIKFLLNNSENDLSFNDLNGNLDGLRIEFTQLHNLWSSLIVKYDLESTEIKENEEKLHNINLVLLLLLSFFEIIASFILIFYMSPIKSKQLLKKL